MTVTNTWAVAALDCYPEYEGHTDVVFVVHWRCDGVDGEHTSGVYGSVGLTLDPEATYAAYDKLTEAQVIGWVRAALGEEQVAAYEEGVAKQIADLARPPVVAPALPWVKQ